MLYIKLNNEKLRRELEISTELITWHELKRKLLLLPEFRDANCKELLRGSEFFSSDKRQVESAVAAKITCEMEYSRLINSNSNDSSDIKRFRSDLAEFRRESTWLANCIFTSVGVSVFVYFCASFYFDSLEIKVISAVIVGIILFFIEVILYVIRN